MRDGKKRDFHSGSSPLARGTDEAQLLQVAVQRFIPACAGNGHLGLHKAHVTPVHPRLRGERLDSGIGKSRPSGSSPLARGTGVLLPRPDLAMRFIPACAGNGAIP